MLRNADGGGGHIFRKKRYEGVMFNVISVTRGWVGVQLYTGVDPAAATTPIYR